jgi:hypothetical protein
MKISELIQELQKIKEAEGDVICVMDTGSDIWEFESEDLMVIDAKDTCKQFFLATYIGDKNNFLLVGC